MTPNRIAAVVVTIVVSVWAAAPSGAQTPPNAPSAQPTYYNDTWHVSISPYLWLAGLNGTLGYGGHEVMANQAFIDIFSNLKFGVMGFTEVQRGPIVFLTDLMYVRLGDETAVPIQGLPPSAVDVKGSLDTFTLTPYFGYRFVRSQRGSIDYIGGGRYYHIGSSITAEAGQAKLSYSTSNNWADFVQGGRFIFNVTPRVRAFFVGDAGGGGSVLTWQIFGGAGYQWSKRWSTHLGYRRLYFNRQTNKGLGLDVTTQGLVVGLTFRLR